MNLREGRQNGGRGMMKKGKGLRDKGRGMGIGKGKEKSVYRTRKGKENRKNGKQGEITYIHIDRYIKDGVKRGKE